MDISQDKDGEIEVTQYEKNCWKNSRTDIRNAYPARISRERKLLSRATTNGRQRTP
jgi:hypothetical protein